VTCDEVRDVVAELVLGTLDGERRAAAAAHLATCAACRREVEELTRVTDALWLVAPEAEPPAGFESRVLRAAGRRGRPRALPRRVLPRRGASRGVVSRGVLSRGVLPRRAGLVAAALLLVLAGAVAGSRQARPAPLAAGRMYDAAHAAVGRAVVSGGAPAYVYVALDSWGHGGDYLVEVVRADGTHVLVAPIHLTGGRGSAGGPLPVPYGDVRAVWVTDADHTEWCGFRL
jgi:anti-sigma factor RsiW